MTDGADMPGQVEMIPMRPETAVMTPFRRGDAVTGTNYPVRCAGTSAASLGDQHRHIDQLVGVTELTRWSHC